MDFNKLSEVNSRTKTIDVKGRPYVEVHERIQAFWQMFPNGRIINHVDHIDGEYVLMHSEIYDGEVLLSTGNAIEFRGDGNINRYGYVENCETSAIGRALGILGIGSCNIASADEVKHKIDMQREDLEEYAKLLLEAKEIDLDLASVHKYAEAKTGISASDNIPNAILKASIAKKKGALALNANAPAGSSK